MKEVKEVNLEIRVLEEKRAELKKKWSADYKEYIKLGKELKVLKGERYGNVKEESEKKGEVKRAIDDLKVDFEEIGGEKLFELSKLVGLEVLEDYEEWKWRQYKSYWYVMWKELKKLMVLEDGELMIKDVNGEMLNVRSELEI